MELQTKYIDTHGVLNGKYATGDEPDLYRVDDGNYTKPKVVIGSANMELVEIYPVGMEEKNDLSNA